MYVSAYCDRCVDLYDVGFFDQQLTCFVANLADLRFRDYLAGAELRNCPGTCISKSARSIMLGSQYLSKSLIFTLVALGRAGLRGTRTQSRRCSDGAEFLL